MNIKILSLLVLVLPLGVKSQVERKENQPVDTLKSVTIDDVVVEKKKKAVEHLPDRVIYNISEQSMLNSGSMLQGLKKIPGMIASESVDLMYQGKSLDVYMDGRPLRIGGNSLITFLEGLPANSVERIEIITSPGAEFSASSGNAIINIISSQRAVDFTTVTYAGNYSFSNYEKFRNKTNNNIFLASKFNKLSWRINLGQSYKESLLENEIIDVLHLDNDRVNDYRYVRPSLTYHLNNAKISLDYDLSRSDLKNTIRGLNVDDKTRRGLIRSDLAAGYQRIFKNPQKKFETKLSYTTINQDFTQHEINSTNKSDENIYALSVDYSLPLQLLDGSKLSLGSRYDREQMDVYNNEIPSLDVTRNTFAAYTEFQTKYDSYDLILGLRGENYNNTSQYGQDEILYNRFKLFPNATLRYNIMSAVFASINYNKKIRLPSINSLNPDNTIFENAQLSYAGNPYLEPTITNTIGVKFSAFDYATIGYDLNYVKNDIIFLAEKIDDRVNYSYQHAPDLTVSTLSVGLPLPLMLFTKGFNELMKFDFDIEKMNLLYFYFDYQKYKSSLIGHQTGIWSYFISGQFVIPSDISLQTVYKITRPGNSRYYLVDKPFQHSFDINISKKFLKDKLAIAIYANDIFNTDETVIRTLPLRNGISNRQKLDTRSFGISLNYKIFNAKKGEKYKDIDGAKSFENDIPLSKY